MRAPHPEGRCWCPVCTADAALLKTGRPAMALALLRDLPEAIGEMVAAAYQDGLADSRADRGPAREAQGSKLPVPGGKSRPGFPAELRAHIDHIGADRVAEVLGVRVVDLGPLIEGRVGLPKSAPEKLASAT